MICAEARYHSDVGHQFGRLTLRSVLPRRIGGRVAGEFECACGTQRTLPIQRVKSGHPFSCGCAIDQRTSIKHGMRRSREYATWVAMKGRCLSPTHKDYPRYGAVGVRIRPAWAESFEAFYVDVGPRPNGTTLDRIDTRGDYVPGNVRWASASTQATNRISAWTVEIAGKRYPSVEDAARGNGVTATTIVRWCDGYVDRRRSDAFTPARDGCQRRRTYG